MTNCLFAWSKTLSKAHNVSVQLRGGDSTGCLTDGTEDEEPNTSSEIRYLTKFYQLRTKNGLGL